MSPSLRPARLKPWQSAVLWVGSHPLVGLAGLLLGIAGIVLAFLLGRNPDLLLADQRKDLGVSGDLGEASVTATAAECGKSIKDLSAEFQEGFRKDQEEDPSIGELIQGQMCVVTVRVRNESNERLPVLRVVSQLSVDEDQYDFFGVDGSGEGRALMLFPRDAMQVHYLFDIPTNAAPTEVRFKLADMDDEITYRWPS